MLLLYRRLTILAGMDVVQRPFYAVIIMEHPLKYPKSTFYLNFLFSSHVNEYTRRLYRKSTNQIHIVPQFNFMSKANLV